MTGQYDVAISSINVNNDCPRSHKSLYRLVFRTPRNKNIGATAESWRAETAFEHLVKGTIGQ
jgi:hypothetical protein